MLKSAFDHLDPSIETDSFFLDLGCGQGYIAGLVNHWVDHVLGMDLNLKGILENRKNYPSVQFVAANAEQIPLSDASVDLLFCYSVLQYTHRPRVLSECSRVLKPGGRFVFLENLQGNPFAKIYRLGKRFLGRSYPELMTPKSHLPWRERRMYDGYFSQVNYQAFHLFTPLMAFLPGMTPSSPEPGFSYAVLRNLFGKVHQIDTVLLRSLPFLYHFSWCAVIYGVR